MRTIPLSPFHFLCISFAFANTSFLCLMYSRTNSCLYLSVFSLRGCISTKRTSWLSGMVVVKKNTCGLFSGNMLYIVTPSAPSTINAVAKTKVIVLDSKNGGSMRFCTCFSPLIMLIVEKNIRVMQEKIYKYQ